MSNYNLNKEKDIAGVVILYNPDENVIPNINTYFAQIDYLYIIDNSEESASYIIEFIKYNSSGISYIFNNENIGVAAALNLAARRAIEKGYLFLLTMDQDSAAPPDMVKKLYEGAKLFKNPGIISPLHDNKVTSVPLIAENYSPQLAVMASGNLLNLSVYQEAGDFDEGFFIDFVDTEYCLRLNLKNYKVIQCNKVSLSHREANPLKKKILFRSVYLYNHSPVRFYYKTRNRLYLKKKYKKYFPELFRTESKLFWRTILKVIFFENKKILKLKLALLGYFDFKRHKIGRFENK